MRITRSCGLLAAAFVVLAASSCRRERTEEPAQREVEQEVPRRLSMVEPPLDRAALLLAVAEAASATALGSDDGEARRVLNGRPFEVRIRFGCAAGEPTQNTAGPFTVLAEKDRTIRIRATPDVSLNDPRVAALASGDVESVEGFWLRRPWLLTDGCPVVPRERQAGAGDSPVDVRHPEPADRAAGMDVPPAVGGQQIGLAQFFTDADARSARRKHRAYEVTKVLGPDEQPSAQGYSLVLSGRLRQLPAGRVISCVARSPDAPPDCVVSAEFDRVWIERADTRETLAEWSR